MQQRYPQLQAESPFRICAGFAVLHWVVIAPAAPQQQTQHQRISNADAAANAAARRQQVARQERLHRGFADEGNAAAHFAGADVNGTARGSAGRALQTAGAVERGEHSAKAGGRSGSGGSSSEAGGRVLQQIVSLRHGGTTSHHGFRERHGFDQLLGSPQQVVRAAFYLWVSAANLVAVSTMWARAADAFDAGAAARCKIAICTHNMAALVNETASWTSSQAEDQAAAYRTHAIDIVRFKSEALRCADRRLFGLLGAGATAGQLAGSAVAGAAAAAARHIPALAATLPALLMLGEQCVWMQTNSVNRAAT